jgi:hypothetical protein
LGVGRQGGEQLGERVARRGRQPVDALDREVERDPGGSVELDSSRVTSCVTSEASQSNVVAWSPIVRGPSATALSRQACALLRPTDRAASSYAAS